VIEDEDYYQSFIAGDLVEIQNSWVTRKKSLVGKTGIVTFAPSHRTYVEVLVEDNRLERIVTADLIVTHPV
jgi:hypothetical protein